MGTLKDIKKDNKLANADIATSLGCSVSKVSMILQGRYIHTFSDNEIEQLAQALSNYHTVTFERCWIAMQASYNEWRGTPGIVHERASELQARVEQGLQRELADLPWYCLEPTVPREMGMIEGVLVVPEERRLR